MESFCEKVDFVDGLLVTEETDPTNRNPVCLFSLLKVSSAKPDLIDTASSTKNSARK